MNELFKLTDKVAIVTGGGKGIGASIAEVFSQQEATVHILDIDDSSGEIVAKKLNDAGGKAFYHHCDVANYESVKACFEKVVAMSGKLDLLVNNAGIACIGSVQNTTPYDIDKIYNSNIKSVYNCLHFGVTHMKSNGGGAIVNLASVASILGIADRFAYSMSKGAVYTMTFSVAKDYLKDHIRCNAVGPARVHTPFVEGYLADHYPGKKEEMFEKLSKSQPIGRMAKPLEIAYLVTYLCSEEASFVTGSFYPIDGGFITLNT